MTEIELHEELIDDIFRCAFLVASGDGELSAEEESSLGEVRGYCRKFIDARQAMEFLEETNNLKQARTLFDPDTPIMHNVNSMFTTYLHDVQDSLTEVTDVDSYLEVVDRHASRITDRYLQLLTAFAAERVAHAGNDFNIIKRRIFNRLFESWEITLQEYKYWFARYASAVIFGHYYDKDIKPEDFEGNDEEDDVGEDDISSLLSELLGVDSFEERMQEETQAGDLPDVFQAVIEDDVDSLLEALKAGADANHKIEISGIKGLTPLMLAAERASLEVVTALTAHGANPNAVTDELGHTPLLWSIQGENEDIAEFLIANGADIEPFAEGEADWSPLSLAAENHLVGISKTLLAKGANPNWRDPMGAVPLKHACNHYETDDAVELIKLLLKNKADPKLHDDEGFYPIHNAIDQGNVRLTELLLSNGVPVDLRFPGFSEQSGSLLKRACIWANPEIIKQILDRLPDDKYTENKAPRFVLLQDDGTPTVDTAEGFELITTVLMHGYKDDLDLYDIGESVQLLCENGVKPDLMGLCYAFLFPDVAEIVIPYCKDELNELLQKYPDLPLVYVAGLLKADEEGIKYFSGIKDLWFHAVRSMKACGIDVPEEVELDEE